MHTLGVVQLLISRLEKNAVGSVKDLWMKYSPGMGLKIVSLNARRSRRSLHHEHCDCSQCGSIGLAIVFLKVGECDNER